MLLFFLLIGRWLDSVMRDRARDGVTRPAAQHCAAGALVSATDGTTRMAARPPSIAPGMEMLVAAGERLPRRRRDRWQGAAISTSSLLTGESRAAAGRARRHGASPARSTSTAPLDRRA